MGVEQTLVTPGPWRDLNDLLTFAAQQDKTGISDTTGSWTVILDEDASFVFLSDYYYRLTGFGRDHIRGQHFLDLVPADLPALTKETFLSKFEARRPIDRFSFKRTIPNSEPVYISTSGTPQFDLQGRFIGYYAISQNISEILSEASSKDFIDQEMHFNLLKYQQVIRQTNQGYWYISTAGKTMEVNPALCEMFGYSVEEMMHLSVFDLVDEENADVFRLELEKRKSGFVGPYQITITRKDGRKVACINNPSRIHDESGQHIGSIGLWTDVSELTSLNEELRAAKLQADAANSAKSQFLANMSHEIRTPMNGVVGMAEVLAHSNLDPSDMGMVNAIRESGKSLLSILNDILDFSKIEAGKLELSFVAMSVENTLDQICRLLSSVSAEAQVDLSYFVEPTIPATLIGDELRIRQVITNILGNAIKFSSGIARGGKVSLNAKVSDATGDRITVTICVRDNGIGMDAATQARVFQPFEQADNATTRRFGGTGLGLVISRSLVDQMGGHMELESAVDKGSTFTIHLPLDLAPPTPVAPLAPSLAGLTLVLVGLSDPMRLNYTTYLSHAGAQVFHARTTVAAQQVLKDENIDARQACMVLLERTAADIDAPGGSVGESQGKASHPSGAGPSYLRLLPRLHGQLQRVDADTVSIGLNALSREMLLEAVSLACGSASQQPHLPSDDATKRCHRTHAAAREDMILVAEDNPVNQEVIARQLELLGMYVDIVPTGKAAYEKWDAGDYALILTDLHMPVWDGYELTRAVRAEEQRAGKDPVPIIALTANALQGEKERCLELGMSDYLTKPLEIDRLQRITEYWLASRPERFPAVAGAAGVQVVSEQPFAPAPPPIDVKAMREVFGVDDMDLFSHFVEKFLLTVGPDIRTLADSLSANDAQEARSLSHKIKSSARAIGAIPLADLCHEIEKFSPQTRPLDASTHAQALLQHFQSIEEYAASGAMKSSEEAPT